MRNVNSLLLVAFCLACAPQTKCCIEKYETCGCKNSKFKDPAIQGKKLYCRKINVANMFADADFPEDITLISVDLSDNNVRELSKATFGQKLHTLHILEEVIKLDFSQNEIWKIAAGSFSLFPNLTRLNLSRNSIGRLTPTMFSSLPKLEILDLSMNKFPIVPGDVFVSLSKLRRLALKSTDLVCNCLMREFIVWVKSPSVTPRVTGTCHLPLTLRGTALKTLDPNTMKCNPNDTLNSLPYFEMIPSAPQLVFEGDQLRMQCEGTNLPTSRIFWSFNGELVNFDALSPSSANTSSNLYKSIITGWLKLDNLTRKHSGSWNCTVISEHGSETRTVKIMVVKRDSSYCGQNEVDNDRGRFTWPATISGITKSVTCPIAGSRSVEMSIHRSAVRSEAQRDCIDGNWTSGSYQPCPYKDEVTRLVYEILHSLLTEKNIPGNVAMLLKRVDGKPLLQPLSVDLISQLMEKSMSLLSDSNRDDVGTALLNLASYVMDANTEILKKAEQESGACERILRIIRRYTLEMASSPDLNKGSANIAIGGNMIQTKAHYNKEGEGMSCKVVKSRQNLGFACDMMTQTKGQGIQPFISFPKSLLDSCEDNDTGYKLYYIAYRNSTLFQSKVDNLLSLNGTLTSSQNMVLETGISGCNLLNLSDAIIINFETATPGSHSPAVWTPGHVWSSSKDCIAPHYRLSKNFTHVLCHKMANLTLLYDPNSVTGEKSPWSLADLGHPIILAGTAVLIVCLTSVMVSYLCCSSRLRISSDSCHMLINICVHLLLVSCAFTLGIWRVDFKVMCLACKVILHYASLSVLMWITLSAQNIRQEMIAHRRPPSLEPKPPRPMLRYYLIGCGVPIVVCSITAAAKVENYTGGDEKYRNYCWLSWDTSLYAFYLPAALTSIVCIILLIRVLCTLNHHSMENDSPSSPLAHSSWQGNARITNRNERYQAICDQNFTERASFQCSGRMNGGSLHTGAPFLLPRANEQSYKTQLCTVALLFVFYLLTWVAGALSVAAPSMQEKVSSDHKAAELFSYADYSYWREPSERGSDSTLGDVFSYAYAILAAITGIFLVLLHLACRKDVRSSWGYTFSSCKKIRDGYRRNSGTRSLTSSQRMAESDDIDETQEHNGEFMASSNDKTSTPRVKKDRGVFTTIKTDPTMETILQSAHLEQPGNGNAHGSQPFHYNKPIDPSSLGGMPYFANGSQHFSFVPCQESGRPAKSITSLHSGCLVKHPDHTCNASFRAQSHMFGSSSGHRHPVHRYPHEHFVPADPRGYVPDPHMYRHHGFHHHHHPGRVPHQHLGKPVKLTNLHMAHDSSMTEHSFDELAHNNMHTVPVVLQHRSQPKINNSALIDRYQKVRKALERKRARQKKLNVLREYAHDPLTSNDEDLDQKDSKPPDPNESSPLIQSPEHNASSNNAAQQNVSKYRALLISPPANKRADPQKMRNGGPAKRAKRLDQNGPSRPIRGDKRAKQNSRVSHNSTMSERERGTTSSEKSRNVQNPSKSKNLAKSGPPSESHAGLYGESTSKTGTDNHGYLTFQQLQNANPFLFHSPPTEQSAEPAQSSPKTSPKDEGSVSGSRLKFDSSPNSHQLPHRNETSV